MAGSVAIGTLTFDTGSTAAPVAGTIITATSGATGVVYVVTLSSGAWGDNDAAGTITLGKCDGLFNDNEAVTWTGGSCTVNHPDGSVGADGFIKNGAFVHDNDPPNDWTPKSSATLTTEAGGKVGNCLLVARSDVDNPYVVNTDVITLVIGKIYKLTITAKQKEEATVKVLFDATLDFPTPIISEEWEAPDNWNTTKSWTFVADSVNNYIALQVKTTNGTDGAYFDEVSLYEIREVQGMIGDGYFMYL